MRRVFALIKLLLSWLLLFAVLGGDVRFGTTAFVASSTSSASSHQSGSQAQCLRMSSRQPTSASSLPVLPRMENRAKIPLPHPKNILNDISFTWAQELMERGNQKPLELEELWLLDESQLMSNASETFDNYLRNETRLLNLPTGLAENTASSSQHIESTENAPAKKGSLKSNLLFDFWASPLTRAVVKMYSGLFIVSGVLKLFNTLVQFAPSLLIARILKVVDEGGFLRAAAASSAAGASIFSTATLKLLLRDKGFLLSIALFILLCAKTYIENQYFHVVTNLGSNVRGVLSAAIYRKSLKLSSSGRQNNTVGEIVNFMQLDTNRMEYVASSIHVVWDGLLQVLGYTALLLHFLGPAVLAGIAAMLVIVPVNAYFFKKLSALRAECLKYTDERVKVTNEVLQGVRAIKAYNWEQPFIDKLNKIRELELASLKSSANTRAILISVLSTAPSVVAVVTLGVYALLGNALTPTKVFTALALFNQLRFPLIFFPMLLNTLAEGIVSLNRLTKFMLADEVEGYVQSFSPDSTDAAAPSNEVIKISDGASFSWSTTSTLRDDSHAKNATTSSLTPPSTPEASSVNPNARSRLTNAGLSIKKGELVAVVGPVGSGKSLLLNALLGELHKEAGEVTVNGRVAYVPQSAWIPNESLQNVVLFGRPMDQMKYAMSLRVCGLTKDLSLFEAGDQTEIGERGVNLSGGQRQRVSLARAVYDDADIYLLDDPLSALDAGVGASVFHDCIKGRLRGKTRVLVTHQLNVLPACDRIIIMGKCDGRTNSPFSNSQCSLDDEGSCCILDQGTLAELLERGHDLSKLVRNEETPANTDEDGSVDAAAAAATTAATDASLPSYASDKKSVSQNVDSTASSQISSSTTTSSIEGRNSNSGVTLGGVSSYQNQTLQSDIGAEHLFSADSLVHQQPLETDMVDFNSTGLASAVDSQNSLCVGCVPPTGGIVDICGDSVDCLLENPETATAEAAVAVAVANEDTSAMPHSLPPAATPSLSFSTTGSSTSSQTSSFSPSSSLPKPTVTSSSASAGSKTPQPLPPKKLMTVEERGEGAVSLSVYKAYIDAARKPTLLVLIIASFLMANASQILQQWVVAAWTSDVGYVKRPLAVYLGGVTFMAALVAFSNWTRTVFQVLIGASASQTLHENMIKKVLSAPLNYFESTPLGRLMQRMSKDLDQIDQQLPGSFAQLIASALQIVGSMMAISIVTPSFGLVMLPVFMVYFRITNYYRTVARELKRLDSISRSPIYSHFSESLGGLPVIRSFRRQRMFQRTNELRLDDNISAYYSLKVVDRWLSVRLELLGNIIVLLSSLLAVASGSRAGSAGISLNNALSITSLLNWAVRNGAETESLMNSVERVLYTTTQTPSEGLAKVDSIPATAFRTPPTASSETPLPQSDKELLESGWPWSGGIVFNDVKMKYRSDFDLVLKGVNLSISPGERVGVVGRTGSGKSSLFRALLRLTDLDAGSIEIDGLDISAIGFKALRSSISIIPQDPYLFSGEIRLNLDPFSTHSDEILWDALRKANLHELVASLPGGLSYQVSEGGSDFSEGQRQLFCLARALVRRSKILLLDEATSSIDSKTSGIIAKMISEEFGGGSTTVLTIAHRLDTIMDSDKVLVMEAGKVLEYDSPQALLLNRNSHFSILVASEGTKEDSADDVNSEMIATISSNTSSNEGDSTAIPSGSRSPQPTTIAIE